jgi:hypothetical protein
MKAYNNMSELEQEWIREYESWCKCGKDALRSGMDDIWDYAYGQAMDYQRRLSSHGIGPMDY